MLHAGSLHLLGRWALHFGTSWKVLWDRLIESCGGEYVCVSVRWGVLRRNKTLETAGQRGRGIPGVGETWASGLPSRSWA